MKRTLEVSLIGSGEEYQKLLFEVFQTDCMVGNILTVPEPDDSNAYICRRLLGLNEESYLALATTVPETDPRSDTRTALYATYFHGENEGKPLEEKASSLQMAIINAVIKKYNSLLVK